MRLTLWLFGKELFDFKAVKDQPPAPNKSGMEAGAGHNFERDFNPPNPSREEPWQDRFGFQAVGRLAAEEQP